LSQAGSDHQALQGKAGQDFFYAQGAARLIEIGAAALMLVPFHTLAAQAIYFRLKWFAIQGILFHVTFPQAKLFLLPGS
jgi:hypothetical protein